MRVLFIGNSHTYYNDMPCLFAEIMRASGKPVEITMLTRGGQSLEGHIRSEQTRFNLRYGHYDFAVLQEVTSSFPEREKYIKDVSVIKSWCDAAGTSCGLYMNFEPPRDTKPLEEMRSSILSASAQLSVPVARVGEAFRMAAQTLPHIDLYFTDRHHASAAGSYLIALTIAHDLFGADVTDAPRLITWKNETLLSLDDDTAKALKRLAQTL